MVAARIDLTRLVAPSEPEPPALLTTLLRLAFDAIKSLPPPLPVNANELLEPQRSSSPDDVPQPEVSRFLSESSPAGAKTPMRPTDAAHAAFERF